MFTSLRCLIHFLLYLGESWGSSVVKLFMAAQADRSFMNHESQAHMKDKNGIVKCKMQFSKMQSRKTRNECKLFLPCNQNGTLSSRSKSSYEKINPKWFIISCIREFQICWILSRFLSVQIAQRRAAENIGRKSGKYKLHDCIMKGSGFIWILGHGCDMMSCEWWCSCKVFVASQNDVKLQKIRSNEFPILQLQKVNISDLLMMFCFL